MAVMEALLFRHPLLDPFAESVNVSFEWAAECARRHGMTPDEAADRLRITMVFGAEETVPGAGEDQR